MHGCGRSRWQPRLTLLAVTGAILPAARVVASPPEGEVVAWQVALDRALMSPGVIDGRWGPKSQRAIRAFQRRHGLPVTGLPDADTRAAVGVDPGSATRPYQISRGDVDQVGPWPRSWQEKARVDRLGYKSLAALVAERGHCSIALLARLNPGRRLDQLEAGDIVNIPNVGPDSVGRPRAAALQINLASKTIEALDESGRLVALFHCSIAKDKSKRPSGRAAVKVVSPNPVYVFDPAMWPEVKGVDRKLIIPPGPRNPVGLFWVGLSLPGYGIHGTPEPELIGKTGSHGCFRLANWDATRLGSMVRPGVPVDFIQHDPKPVAMAAAAPASSAALLLARAGNRETGTAATSTPSAARAAPRRRPARPTAVRKATPGRLALRPVRTSSSAR